MIQYYTRILKRTQEKKEPLVLKAQLRRPSYFVHHRLQGAIIAPTVQLKLQGGRQSQTVKNTSVHTQYHNNLNIC